MKITFLAFLFALSSNCFAQCPVIPTPRVYSRLTGELELNKNVSIQKGALSPENIQYFKQQLLIHGLELTEKEKDADIAFTKGEDFVSQPTYYSIVIDTSIRIVFKEQVGAFYAINTLLQLIESKNDLFSVGKCSISDQPRFEWRGLHLDVSRHFFSVEDIKNFIDLMALYKFNVFHWHLTDDQGWRIEIDKYPKLTSIGAYRDSTVIGHYSDSPREYEKKVYGGFYSKEDVREIVKYAAERFIDVLPEIELPGHSRAALAAYPEYSCNLKQNPVPGLWGIFDDIYCSKKESIQFMKDVLDEVLELFPNKYIHIGGDEAPKTRWKECDNCQKTIAENGLKDEHELQSYFIRQIDQHLSDKGRKLIGWDEILEGGLSPNATVMSWRGELGGIQAAKLGHDVVMSPTTYCYFDYYQSSHDIEPLAIGGYLPLEKVYKFKPVPAELDGIQAQHVLGGQANLWTEYMPNMDHVEYMAFPRALALMQNLWCTEKPSFEEFLDIYTTYHESYLDLHDVNYARSIHYPHLSLKRDNSGMIASLSSASPDAVFNLKIIKQVLVADTSIRKVTASDSIFIPRVEGHDGKISLIVSSDQFEGEVVYNFKLHSEIGLPVELVTPAHPKFDNNAGLNLVDGIEGRRPWKGSEWLGFQLSEIEIIIDMEKENYIDKVDIGFLEDNGSWIYLPEGVEFEVSMDRFKWKKVKKVVSQKDSKEVTFDKEDMEFYMHARAKYLKIKVRAMEQIPLGLPGAGHLPWTFIDELQILYAREWK